MRIIPARAGFTGRRARFFQADADHPRSRGVYVTPWGVIPARVRIIPARAGFTPEHLGSGHNTGGSSPLARGLLIRSSM